jgi:hypothetical protein
MTIASAFAYASVRSDSPNVRDSSRVFGNRGASPAKRRADAQHHHDVHAVEAVLEPRADPHARA